MSHFILIVIGDSIIARSRRVEVGKSLPVPSAYVICCMAQVNKETREEKVPFAYDIWQAMASI